MTIHLISRYSVAEPSCGGRVARGKATPQWQLTNDVTKPTCMRCKRQARQYREIAERAARTEARHIERKHAEWPSRDYINVEPNPVIFATVPQGASYATLHGTHLADLEAGQCAAVGSVMRQAEGILRARRELEDMARTYTGLTEAAS